jgi:membrane associated rhomboid family serine protease
LGYLVPMGETFVEGPTDDLVPVGRFDDLESAREYVLVVLAMNLDCLITVEEFGYQIHGEAAFAEAIREEFRLYQAEQEERVEPAAIPVPIFGSGVNLALVWISTLLVCLAQQLESSAVTERFLSDSIRIREHGEYYRAFTALFLHADLEHLLGNAVFGTLFGVFAANSFGPWRGWGLILASGFLGNLLSVALQSPDHVRALGASTAVFGALGLLVGSGLAEFWRIRSHRPGIRILGPLLAGVMIFTMNGIGKPGTDTLAHLTGMACGVALGLPVAAMLSRRTTGDGDDGPVAP